ncbi:hypothetical protein CcI6DRAFT_00342 [Frankia sp. CcI6]|nr:hypothetical protein CcI6DRAFT_00342 [Frankia sp. CcI6]KFB05655.1 hypothetical protein ALLO2DRAFT_01607 [Frankia sp. Allo2]
MPGGDAWQAVETSTRVPGTGAAPEAWRVADPGRRWLVIGVVAAGMVFSALGVLVAAVVPPFTSADEAQHTAYAFDVADGSLPVLDSPVHSRIPSMPGLPADCVVPPPQARAAVASHVDRLCGVRLGRPLANVDLTYTANHPPLFYAVEAVPLRTGVALDHPLAGFRAARLLNVAFGITAVIATAALVRGVLPGRPGVAVGAAAIVGVVGMFVLISGQVYNDTLAVATITGLLAVTVAIIRRGPGPRTLAALAVLGPAAAASRASGALAVAVVVPALAVAVSMWTSGGALRRAGRGLTAAVVLVALTFAATGWFYLRNVRRYGDPTASGRVAEMFPIRDGRTSAWQVSRDSDFWWHIYRGFFGRSVLLTGHARTIAVGVAVVTGAGLVAAGIRVLGARLRTVARPGTRIADTTDTRPADDGADDGHPEADPPGGRLAGSVVIGLLLTLHCLLVVATLVGYVAVGGAPFTRYLLPILPILALVVAACCGSLPLGRRGLPTVAVVAALAALTVVMLIRDLAFKRPALAPLANLDRLRTAWDQTAPGPPDLGLSCLAGWAVLGGVLLVVALWKLADPAVDGRGELRGAPPGERAGVRPAGVGVAGGVEQLQDRFGEVVGERVAVGLPNEPHRTGGAGDGQPGGLARGLLRGPAGGGGDVDESGGDLPHGRDVGGDHRSPGGERLQGG